MSIPELDREKILVVSASLDLQKEFRQTLSSYLVVAVNNAQQAIEKLTDSNDFSAVLVGIFLEETKGFYLLDYFKSHTEFYTGPVLVIVDSITDDVIDKLKDYNIFDYVVRRSNDLLIKTTVRNAVVYYVEKSKLINYAVGQVFETFNDMKLLVAVLAQIVEFKNFESGPHTEHVGMITRILCNKLIEKYNDKYGLSQGDVYYISLASCLHDIGKIYIPEYILNKPGKLDDEEMEIMKDHTVLGAGIIKRLPKNNERILFKYIYDICLYHHERYDGTGYPKGLSADEIPIWAQIVSVADCYDALTSDRVYRKAYSHADAVMMMVNGSCRSFNQDVIACLISCSDEIKAAKFERTSSNITKEAFNNIIADVLKIK